MIKKGLLFFICITTLSLLGQQNPVLDRFSGVHNNGVVYLEWVMSSGTICSGVVITRSTDSINFSKIGEIPGFCGSLSSATTYRFQDEKPVMHKKVFYRLELGTIAISEILSVYVPATGVGEYQLFPNPVISESKLQFQNPTHSVFVLKIYDSKGLEIHSENTEGESFIINTESLLPGLYYFILYEENSNASRMSGNFYKIQS